MEWAAGFPAPQRAAVCIGLTAFLFTATWVPTMDAYHKEKSAALTGYLKPSQDGPKNFLQSDVCNIIQFGEDGVSICWDKRAGDQFAFFPDSRLRIERGELGEPIISTEVRDREGHFVAELVRNKWRVSDSSAVVWDKNYTDDSLEVKDRRGHVVLQIRLFLKYVQLQGVWYDDSGKGVQLAKNPTNRSLEYVPLGHREPDGAQNQEIQINPIFLYPSSEHFGEFISKQP
jgi:hypothetical protein